LISDTGCEMMTEQRIAIVTGASSGIGRSMAERLAEDGMVVAVNYRRSPEGAEAALNNIRSAGGNGGVYRADVAVLDEVVHMVEAIEDEYGRLDVLVCNAGIYTRTDLDGLRPEKWDETLRTNLTGAYNCTYASKELLKRSGRTGRIVYITSQLAYRGTVQGAHYSASKSGLIGLMKSAALSFAPLGVTVNAVAPGFVDTPLIAGDSPEKRRSREEQVPLRRVGVPEDIAGAVSFLCSPEAGYITGETIHVNGGLLMY